MGEERKIRKTKKLRKLEERISKLTEKNEATPKERITKKIAKLEKKKARLEKWLKIKFPFRFLIKTAAIWLIIVGVCYGCSYIPVVREVKSMAMAAIAYVAPESVATAIDVVTFNVGTNNSDFEWLKSTLNAYISGEVKINVADTNSYSFSSTGDKFYVNDEQVSEERYREFVAEKEREGQEQREKDEKIMQEIFGTTSIDSMPLTQVVMKVITNTTPEIVSQVLDMSGLDAESKERVESDVNRALKIIPKLNNNQMNELVGIVTGKVKEQDEQLMRQAEEAQKNYEDAVRREEELLKELSGNM